MRLPSHLTACRHSYQAVQPLYSRCFDALGCNGQSACLNLAIDVVYLLEILFYGSFLVRDFLQKDLSDIRYVAVDFETGYN